VKGAPISIGLVDGAEAAFDAVAGAAALVAFAPEFLLQALKTTQAAARQAIVAILIFFIRLSLTFLKNMCIIVTKKDLHVK
jgi:hypothetical protein